MKPLLLALMMISCSPRHHYYKYRNGAIVEYQKAVSELIRKDTARAKIHLQRGRIQLARADSILALMHQ